MQRALTLQISNEQFSPKVHFGQFTSEVHFGPLPNVVTGQDGQVPASSLFACLCYISKPTLACQLQHGGKKPLSLELSEP